MDTDREARVPSFPDQGGDPADVERAILASIWWARALGTPDRHYPAESGRMLADHLTRTRSNVEVILQPSPPIAYLEDLQRSLQGNGLEPRRLRDILIPVALLHDIGKPEEDHTVEVTHPLSGKAVQRRHPVMGVFAAKALLPPGVPNRDVILTLVSEHDLPFSWYMQAQRTGAIPARKSWRRLDAKITGRRDGVGIRLLAVFKLAEIDGHQVVDDVPWFVERANEHHLEELGCSLPVPTRADVQAISTLGGS